MYCRSHLPSRFKSSCQPFQLFLRTSHRLMTARSARGTALESLTPFPRPITHRGLRLQY